MDAILIFDVLIYINFFYYPLFAIIHPLIIVAKFYSPNYPTPKNIAWDAAVVVLLIFSDFFKIIIFRKQHQQRRVLAVLITVFLTCVSLCCVLYILLEQEHVIRMEYIICCITLVLFSNELAFGTLQFTPCGKQIEYM